LFDQIVFGICWYNDPSIFRLLDSLPKQIRKKVIDGKFMYNSNRSDLSDESLRKKVKEYENVELIDAPNLAEPRKRDKYLIDNEYKYLIISDSDEFLVAANWEEFFDDIKDLKEGIHNLFIETDAMGGTSTYPRLWVNPKDWRYTMCHNIFKNDKLGLIQRSGSTNGKTIRGLLFSTDDNLRSEEYLKQVSEYQGHMIKFEIPFRHAFRDGNLEPFK
jgi:hypothetical protein